MMYVHIFLLVIILKIDLCILCFFILLQKLKINEAKEDKKRFSIFNILFKALLARK